MGLPLRALIVEDSENDTRLLARHLELAGYEPRLQRVDTPEELGAALAERSWDIVFADYTMPRFRGTEALALVRTTGLDVPFIFLSGTIGEDTAVAAMKSGAHDYIMKDNLERHIPAVQRELREAEMRRERKREQERIWALFEISTAISSTLELQTLLHTLLQKIDLFLPYDGTSVRLISQATGELEASACWGADAEKWKASLRQSDFPWDRRVVETNSPVAVTDLTEEPHVKDRDFLRRHGWVSYLGVPLTGKGAMLGVLAFYTKEKHVFTQDETRFLSTLGSYAATAIHNARLHEETRKQATELDKANRVKSEFLGIMSHELRTPLTVIMGYAAIVHDKLKTDGQVTLEQEQALQKILKYTSELSTMVNSILHVTRIEAGPIQVETSEVDLSQFLADLQQSYPYPGDKDLAVTWDYPPDLPPVATDGSKLKHVLQNLIHNAIKFTPQGKVTIAARDLPEARSVEFTVADTGIGIPKESLPIIFDMFRQVDGSQARSRGGVGLGLYIVKKFTELLGGKVAVASEPNRGTTFTLTIPRAGPLAAAAA
jgi:signal transduction histidine kinase/FixJ family two-component response regulator